MEWRVNLNSETGRLRAVVLHRPGIEMEQMSPATIKEALYSDLLSTSMSQKEYRQLEGVLGKVCRTLYLDDLLGEALEKVPEARVFVFEALRRQGVEADLLDRLQAMSVPDLVRTLVQGEPGTSFNPLYNLYFTRDIGVCFNSHAMITHMATRVRAREILVTDTVYKFHPLFAATGARVNPWEGVDADTRLEGGDFQVCGENVFVIGQGMRSNRKGVEAFIRVKAAECPLFYVILQELPSEPESFIHLDMVFTFLSHRHCMAYKPLIMDGGNRYKTALLRVENGRISETRFDTVFAALRSLGYDYEPVFCGDGKGYYPDREQWHSGANFFSFAPGRIMGYGRNTYTIEALNRAGFEVIPAWDVVEGRSSVDADTDGKLAVYTIESSELVRGGGGCRCMTMPVCRDDV